ncbi:MAG: ADP-ribose 1''-phosphate phosphatase [Bathelium mastoideum]|nr:MAG: ADP-ribose 1''-phosphate phosphatase [Bathelium mastoideum]
MASKRKRPLSGAKAEERQLRSKTRRVDEDSTESNAEAQPEQAKANESDSPGLVDNSSFLRIEERVGDIFDAPNHSVLIHACNCEGSWGAGIAAAFKKRYPEAFQKYKKHCDDSSGTDLRGTAFLIEPCEGTEAPEHFIGCLFTSAGKGKTKDKPATILQHTGPAMRNLLRRVGEVRDGGEITEVRMCRINSGLFKVPWEKSKAVLEEIRVEGEDWPSIVASYSPK